MLYESGRSFPRPPISIKSISLFVGSAVTLVRSASNMNRLISRDCPLKWFTRSLSEKLRSSSDRPVSFRNLSMRSWYRALPKCRCMDLSKATCLSVVPALKLVVISMSGSGSIKTRTGKVLTPNIIWAAALCWPSKTNTELLPPSDLIHARGTCSCGRFW